MWGDCFRRQPSRPRRGAMGPWEGRRSVGAASLQIKRPSRQTGWRAYRHSCRQASSGPWWRALAASPCSGLSP